MCINWFNMKWTLFETMNFKWSTVIFTGHPINKDKSDLPYLQFAIPTSCFLKDIFHMLWWHSIDWSRSLYKESPLVGKLVIYEGGPHICVVVYYLLFMVNVTQVLTQWTNYSTCGHILRWFQCLFEAYCQIIMWNLAS